MGIFLFDAIRVALSSLFTNLLINLLIGCFVFDVVTFGLIER